MSSWRPVAICASATAVSSASVPLAVKNALPALPILPGASLMQLLGELDDPDRGVERRDVAEAIDLRVERSVHLRVRLAERHREDAAEEVEVLATVEILEPRALAAVEADRLLVEGPDAREEELLVLRAHLARSSTCRRASRSIAHYATASPPEAKTRGCRAMQRPVKLPGAAMLRGLLVFAVTYALVATRSSASRGSTDRQARSSGAVLAVAVGAITPDEAAKAVDHTTIVLLFAVMGMGAFLSLDGFFERAGRIVVARAKTRRRLVGALVWGSGCSGRSSRTTPCACCSRRSSSSGSAADKLPRLPLLAALATGANTGSVATLVGNPQNMLCGSLGKLHFAPFLLHMVPVALVGLAINHALLLVDLPRASSTATCRRGAPPEAAHGALGGDARRHPRDGGHLHRGGSLAFTALGGFARAARRASSRARDGLGAHRLVGARLLRRALRRGRRARAERRGGVGLLALPAGRQAARARGWLRAAGIFLVGSNVVTNVPFILIVRPEMAKLPDPTLGWELLAMASTFAGNLTLLGVGRERDRRGEGRGASAGCASAST